MPAKNILIADDDQIILDLLKEILQREGYQIFLASNGEEAVEAIKRYPIDVAILDIKMPIMDGIEALKRIKKIDSTVEVLIMTGYADIETLRQSLIDYGAFDYLLKPLKIKREEICNAVRSALLKRDHALKDDFLEKELNNRILQLEKDFEEKTRQFRESQIKYMEIVENSTDGILIAQDEKLKFVNPKALELTGFTEEEVLNIPFIELVYPEDRSMVMERFMRRLQGDEISSPFTSRVLRKEGDSFWAEINAIKTIWEERPAVMANIKDINDRVESEKKLRESEEKYRDLADSIADIFFAIDGDLKYAYWNKASEKLTGISAKDAIGRQILEIFPDNEETRRALKAYQEVIKTQQSQTFINEFHLGGKQYFFEIDAYPSSNGVSVFVKDITERKCAEETLRESEERYRSLVESTQDSIYLVDGKCRYLFVNQKHLSRFGLPRDKVIGRGYGEFHSEEETKEFAGKLKEVFETDQSLSYEYISERDGGYYIRTLSPVKGPDGRTTAVNVVSKDITERKQAERYKERLLAELEAKNKELESFVYSISHDLKTPLVSLQGFSSLLQRELHGQLDEEGKHYMERIQDNVTHMDSLISDLLELSRIGRVVGPMEEIDMAALLREIQQDLAVELEETSAELVVQEPLPAVHADPGRIRQVFTNLIENALKFRSRDRPLRIEVGCKEERGSYRIHVADNGIGIAPQYQEQIFNPFRKLDPKTEGMGIGLALVKKIVEHHGGRVWIESPSTLLRTPTEAAEGQEGGGATFYLTLPRREES